MSIKSGKQIEQQAEEIKFNLAWFIISVVSLGAATGLLSSFPFLGFLNFCFGLLFFIGGFFATSLYAGRRPIDLLFGYSLYTGDQKRIPLSHGILIGALTAVIAALVEILVIGYIWALFPTMDSSEGLQLFQPNFLISAFAGGVGGLVRSLLSRRKRKSTPTP